MPSPHANPLIRKIERLYPLTLEEQELLENSCSRVVEFAADKDIVIEGDKPVDCNLLLEGMVCRYKILEDGKRQIFSFHIPGDIFDAQSFLLETMDHNVGTLTPCKVAMIPHAAMHQLTEQHPRIARALWKDTLVDAAIFREWIANVARRDAYQRIAHLMCEMVVKYQAIGMAEDHSRIDWPMTQAELGDATGLSVVHVNRTLQELRNEQLITLREGVLVVLDWEGLQRAGHFAPRYLHLKSDRPSARNGGGAHSTA
jgi:CRP-like cAMP-binding protein